MDIRVGIGFDAHALEAGVPLVLGGVSVDYPRGLAGHSDGDVIAHALIDALLGAARLGDIGDNYPSGDLKYKDISSLRLLELVRIKIANAGYQVENIDATVICDKPMLGELKISMSKNIANELEVSPQQVSVKASTTEGLGFTGEGKGIAAMAVALVSEIVTEEEEEEPEEGYEDEYQNE